ncbi:MAG: mandelate racemase, partial [Actinobacteria bacterium]|nr:mandelate racemase [Actinomycetota bacterium]
MASAVRTDVAVERLDVSAYTIPTDGPESDGTFEWDSTTIVVVEAYAGDEVGLGYTYADAAAGKLVESKLADVVGGRDALAPRETWTAMGEALRNVGRPGVGFMALSAVDSALWDLRARLLDVPLVDAIGRAHDCVPIYGSGGFCSYSLERLAEQLAGWVEQGIPRVKMKVSREPDEDVERMNVVRDEIGDEPELYVDSNGALSRKQALYWLDRFAG